MHQHHRLNGVIAMALIALSGTSHAQEGFAAKSLCAGGDSEAAPLFASKAIVFADDPRPTAGQQVASYVVKPQALEKKEPLLLKIQLAHH